MIRVHLTEVQCTGHLVYSVLKLITYMHWAEIKGKKMNYYLTGSQAGLIDKYTQDKVGIPGLVLMEKQLRRLLTMHEKTTGSRKAKNVLARFDEMLPFFKTVMSDEYLSFLKGA